MPRGLNPTLVAVATIADRQDEALVRLGHGTGSHWPLAVSELPVSRSPRLWTWRRPGRSSLGRRKVAGEIPMSGPKIEILQCGECNRVSAGSVTGQEGLPTIGSICIYCKVGRLKLWEPEKLVTPEERWHSIESVLNQVENTDQSPVTDDVEIITEEEKESDELEIDTFITAQRASRNLSRMLKKQYADLQTVRRPCVKCGLACLIASSSDQVIKDLEADGKRAEVICFECCKQCGVDPDKGGITEGQAKELSLILMKRSVQKENTN